MDEELLSASGERDPARVRALLEAGANARCLHRDPRLPLDNSPGKGITPLHAWAAHDPRVGNFANLGSSSLAYEHPEVATREVFSLLVGAGADCSQLDDMDNTPLHHVNDALAARLLIEQGADPDAVNSRGETVLHLCDGTAALRYLLEEARASPNLETKSGSAMLDRLACCDYQLRNFRFDQAHLFLDNGSHPGVTDWNGQTALHLLVQERCSETSKASDDARLQLLERFLSLGIDINVRTLSLDLGYGFQTPEGLTPLHLVQFPRSCVDKAKRLITAMVSAGADLEAEDASGRTPLFYWIASYFDDELVVLSEHMRSLGARLDTRDNNGRTLLHAAARKDGHEVIQWLVKHGVDPAVTDDEGNTLIHESVPVPKPEYHYTRIFGSFAYLSDLGVDPQRANLAGRTPLHMASRILPRALYELRTVISTHTGSTTEFDWFLHNTRDVDVTDGEGITALHFASTFSEYQAGGLLERGANPLKCTPEGLTALHLAARARQVNIVGMLLDAVRKVEGGSCTSEISSPHTIHPRSPIFYACASGRPETVRLLLDAGMNIDLGTAYIDSALQGCVHFEDELTRWPKGPVWEQRDPRDVGSVTLSDDFRMAEQPGPRPSERIDDILQMLVADNQEWMEKNIDFAISEATDKGAAYVLDCLLRVRDHLSIGDSFVHSDAVTALLEARREARKSFYDGTSTKAPSLSVKQFQAAMDARLFDVVEENLTPEDCLQVVPGRRGASLVLQCLVSGGYSSLVAHIATKDLLTRFENQAWAEAVEAGLDHFVRGAIEPLLHTSCRRSLPNMDVLKVLVEQFQCDVNTPGRGGWIDSCAPEHPEPSALHVLALGGHWWQYALGIPYLVSRGADINARDSDGLSPLNAVLERLPRQRLRFCLQIVVVLLDQGADVRSADKRGITCLGRTEDEPAIRALLLERAETS